jgi:hypothetical protein
LPDDSVNLVLGSPPYEAQRSYGVGFDKKGQDWVDWMVQLFREATRVTTGLVAMVVEGGTQDFRWSATPALLVADLHRAGFNLRKPPIFHRIGIPGSGGPDWLRNDYEFIVCVTRPGQLIWSDATALGKAPLWQPGGDPGHRRKDGTRVNGRGGTSGYKDGDATTASRYTPPRLANPGNVIRCKVGGNNMGDQLAHQNEAPFPEALAEFFIRSFCPPGGVVLDPFTGSGTTGAVAVRAGRQFLGCDIRQDQVDLATKRINQLMPQSDRCLRCGRPVDYKGHGRRQRYCGPACKQAVYRLRSRNGALAEPLPSGE